MAGLGGTEPLCEECLGELLKKCIEEKPIESYKCYAAAVTCEGMCDDTRPGVRRAAECYKAATGIVGAVIKRR